MKLIFKLIIGLSVNNALGQVNCYKNDCTNRFIIIDSADYDRFRHIYDDFSEGIYWESLEIFDSMQLEYDSLVIHLNSALIPQFYSSKINLDNKLISDSLLLNEFRVTKRKIDIILNKIKNYKRLDLHDQRFILMMIFFKINKWKYNRYWFLNPTVVMSKNCSDTLNLNSRRDWFDTWFVYPNVFEEYSSNEGSKYPRYAHIAVFDQNFVSPFTNCFDPLLSLRSEHHKKHYVIHFYWFNK